MRKAREKNTGRNTKKPCHEANRFSKEFNQLAKEIRPLNNLN